MKPETERDTHACTNARTHTHISQVGDGAFRIAEERRNDDDVADKTS